MGITGPKSALVVKDGLTFLDVIAGQTLALRKRHGIELPLVLMNSFRTRDASLALLERYPDLPVDGLPLDFLQSAEPKLRADDLAPVDWPADPELEWCPPGHGDVYLALANSGLLDALLDKGFRYVFLSNADNLGATCDPRIVAWMVEHDVPYLAEVCDRTVNDRKGGHLAVRKSDGRLVLRDSAMVAPGDEEHFQDTGRHTTFHANNLWVDLTVVDRLLRESEDRGEAGIGLPIIVNRKTVDPSDSVVDRGHPDRDRDGRGDRAHRGRPRDPRAPLALPSGQDDQRAAPRALRHLRARRRARWWSPRSTTPIPTSTSTGSTTSSCPTSRRGSRKGVPSMREAASLRVRGDVTFGRRRRLRR